MRRAGIAIAIGLAACGGTAPEPERPAPRSVAPPHARALVVAEVVETPLEVLPASPVTEPEASSDVGEIVGPRTGRHRLIHFTFDDGPRPQTTPRLLRHLARYGVHATFFVVTRALEDPERRDAARETLRRMVDEGHTIGLHGHDHTGFRNLTDEELVDQLRRGARLVEEVTTRTPTLVRPPYGGRDERTDRVLAELGLRQVLWTMTPERPRDDSQEIIVEQFRAQLAERELDPLPGTIVVLHDTRRGVIEAFPRIMRHLQRRNCRHLREGVELWDVVASLDELRLSDDEVAQRQVARRAELRCERAR